MCDDLDRPKFQSFGEKSVRFDLTPKAAESPELTKGSLLDRFRGWMRQSHQERRRMPRHRAFEYQVWLGWERDKEAFFATSARLVDVSRGGALIIVADPPPEGHTAWMCLGTLEPRDCVRATLLEVRTARRSECFVRLRFGEPCPHAFFDEAVCMLARPKSTRGTGSAPRGERA
jgi:hypothetical protein